MCNCKKKLIRAVLSNSQIKSIDCEIVVDTALLSTNDPYTIYYGHIDRSNNAIIQGNEFAIRADSVGMSFFDALKDVEAPYPIVFEGFVIRLKAPKTAYFIGIPLAVGTPYVKCGNEAIESAIGDITLYSKEITPASEGGVIPYNIRFYSDEACTIVAPEGVYTYDGDNDHSMWLYNGYNTAFICK